MAEFGAGELNRGLINVEQTSPQVATVYFRATIETEKLLHLPKGMKLKPVKLLEFDSAENRIRIYPIGTQPTVDRFAQPKYDLLRVISVPVGYLELPQSANDVPELLENLPRGFLKDCQFGLGLAKAYRQLIRAIENQTECKELYLMTEGEAKLEGTRLSIPIADFDLARAEADRIASRANVAADNVKQASAQNWLASMFGQEEIPYKRGRHPMIQAFADAAANNRTLDDEEIDDLLEMIRGQSELISARRPEALAKLKGDIELVELDAFVDRFDQMLTSTSHTEATWQDFFVQNPFILSFAFGYPMILVQDQAVAGGRKISGSGEKIVDFLSKNPTTNNVAIIEIKKPGTPVTQQNQYRGGVYGPSAELTSAITQVLDQRYQLTGEFATLQRASRIYDIESFAVRLCLVVGRTPSDPDRAKSFELYRNSLSTIDIVTFDELLERVRLLRSFLANTAADEDFDPVA